jgi:signal transduction histidine kinase
MGRTNVRSVHEEAGLSQARRRGADGLFQWLPLLSIGALLAIAAASNDPLAMALTAFAAVVFFVGRLATGPSATADRLRAANAADAMAQTEAKLAENVALADLFAHLSRRNQPLLDRHISLLVQLEETERDPERLSGLFELDHLATRIRRNAESMLVLAGIDASPRSNEPVALCDVVRAAAAEVEDYRRVNINIDETLAIKGTVVADLAHMLAELIENAVFASIADERVMVRSHIDRDADGGCIIMVEDQGVGMDLMQMGAANAVLQTPTALQLGNSLGLQVVARLARRHDVSVRLEPTAAGGVTAVVQLPAEVLHSEYVAPRNVVPEPPQPEPEPIAIEEQPATVALTTSWSDDLDVLPAREPRKPAAPAAPAVTVAATVNDLPVRSTEDPWNEVQDRRHLESREAPMEAERRLVRRTPGASLDAVAADSAVASTDGGIGGGGGARPGLFDFDPRALTKFQAAQSAARDGNGNGNGGVA